MCSWQTSLFAMSDGAMALFFGYKTTMVHPLSLRMEGGGRRRRVHKDGKTLLGSIDFDTRYPLAK
jgi:hypothetical protein